MNDGGFFQTDNADVDDRMGAVGASAWMVYCVLRRHRRHDTGVASVTYGQIRSATRMSSQTTIATALRRLEDAGMIQPLHRSGASGAYFVPSAGGTHSVQVPTEQTVSVVESGTEIVPPPVQKSYRSGTEIVQPPVQKSYSPNTTINTQYEIHESDGVGAHAHTREEIVASYRPSPDVIAAIRDAFPGITDVTIALVLEDRKSLWLTGKGRDVDVDDGWFLKHFPRYFKANPRAAPRPPPPKTFTELEQDRQRDSRANVAALMNGATNGNVTDDGHGNPQRVVSTRRRIPETID